MSPAIIAIMFCLLMASVWYNFRIGFAKGVSNGYNAGILHTVNYLIKHGNLSATNLDADRNATSEELAKYIRVQLHEEMVKSRG